MILALILAARAAIKKSNHVYRLYVCTKCSDYTSDYKTPNHCGKEMVPTTVEQLRKMLNRGKAAA